MHEKCQKMHSRHARLAFSPQPVINGRVAHISELFILKVIFKLDLYIFGYTFAGSAWCGARLPCSNEGRQGRAGLSGISPSMVWLGANEHEHHIQAKSR